MEDIVINREAVRELYQSLKEQNDIKREKEIELKEIENELVEELAELKGYLKRDGETDRSKIKKSLLKKAINIVFRNEENKLARDLEILEEYISDLRSDRVNRARNYERVLRELESVKDMEKEISDSFKDRGVEKLVLKAVKELIKKEESEDRDSDEQVTPELVKKIEYIIKGGE